MSSPENNSQRPAIRVIPVVGAVILHPHHVEKRRPVLIVKRKSKKNYEGLWEFPGGKIEPGETKEKALIREVDEELGLNIQVLDQLGDYVHHEPGVEIHLSVYVCEIRSGKFELREHEDFLWVNPQEIHLESLMPADRPFVQRLVDYFHRK